MKNFLLSLCVIFTAILLLTGSAAAAISDVSFLKLCENGTPEAIELAIKDGANVNAADEDNWTALHIAVLSNENHEAIRVLLDNGANINTRDDDGDTPLMNAVISDKPKHILLLLDRGADAGIVDNNGKRPIDYLSDYEPEGVDEAEWETVKERLRYASESITISESITVSESITISESITVSESITISESIPIVVKSKEDFRKNMIDLFRSAFTNTIELLQSADAEIMDNDGKKP